jgi:NAD(P)-dependent dehydrogenase (short-subunit alcohol dehydrogenase family)
MKTILITGGANGIGRAIVEKYIADYNVILIDKDSQGVNELKSKYNKIDCYIETVTNYENICKIIDEIYKRYNNIDILINNAGIQTVETISRLKLKDWREIIEVNLTANFYITQIVSNRMKKGSTILNISSTHYNRPRIDHAHYDISKSGITTLTKLFALELAQRNITVNALAIGATYTNMNRNFEIDKTLESTAKNKIPMKHICSPNEVADYVYNIIKDFSTATTGSVFVVDGGRNLT